MRSSIDRPMNAEKQTVFYAILIGVNERNLYGMPKQPMVEARCSANKVGRGRTELEAVRSLLDVIRETNPEVGFSRLNVWRSLLKPPHPSTRSFEAD